MRLFLKTGVDVAVLTLLSRAYCHLCDEMRDAVVPIALRRNVAVVKSMSMGSRREATFGERVRSCCSALMDGIEPPLHLDADTSRQRWPNSRNEAESVKIQSFPLATFSRRTSRRAAPRALPGALRIFPPNTCAISATFRSSPTSTTGSRRSPIASSSAAGACPTGR